MAGIVQRVSPPKHVPSFGVVSDDRDLRAFDEGLHALTDLIRPAFGPSGKVVAIAGATGRSAPELLTDGATIARRLTELDHRVANAGAMFLRGILQEVAAEVGDGTSATALLFDAMLRAGRRGVHAGLNAGRLRQHLLELSAVVSVELERQRMTVSDAATVERLALSMCRDASLATATADIYASLGPYCHIEVRPSRGPNLGYDFLADAFWPSNCLDTTMLLDLHGQRLDLVDCAIFVSDLVIDDPQLLVSILATAKARGAASLLLIGRSISKTCLALVMTNASPSFPIVAVRTPETAPLDQLETMDDIAVATGASVFREAEGATRTSIGTHELGTCRRAWVSRTHFGLFGGQGASHNVRQRIRDLRASLQNVTNDRRKDQLTLRLSRLTARSAILWINGTTEREIDYRKRLAERTCQVTREALTSGAVLGGGNALLACHRPLADRKMLTSEPEESFAKEILLLGLLAPSSALVQNQGLESSWAVTRALEAGEGMCLDVVTGRTIPPADVAVLDSYAVIATALQKAVAGVAQALTVDAVVLRRRSQTASAS